MLSHRQGVCADIDPATPMSVITVKMTCELHVNAFQCIERPNTALLDCISDTVSLWIQAFYQALHIGASWGVYLRFDLQYQGSKDSVQISIRLL